MTTTAKTKITAIANFPQHYFLENLAVRADGSILVCALNHETLWYIPATTTDLPVDPVLVYTFEPDHLPMGIAETEPDIFYVATLGQATLHRFDLRGWTPGTPARHTHVLTFDPPNAGLNGACALDPRVMLIADCVGGLIWRVDIDDNGLGATARVWLSHPTMAAGEDPNDDVILAPTNVHIPFPGVNGVRYAARSNFVYYTATAAELFMRVAVDPATHEPVGEPERVASIHTPDDFCIDEDANVAYITTHVDNTIQSVPLQPGTADADRGVVVGEPFTEPLVGPTSVVWGRGPHHYGRVAYVSTDGGELLPPAGIVGPGQVVRIDFPASDVRDR